jgi:hypothetical protein
VIEAHQVGGGCVSVPIKSIEIYLGQKALEDLRETRHHQSKAR